MTSSSKNIQDRASRARARKQPVTLLEIVTCVVFILSLAAVIAIIIKCLLMAAYHHRDNNSADIVMTETSIQYSKGDEPCCLPFKFQAVITPLATFDANQKKLMRVYRDWESRLQAMEQTFFDDNGIIHVAYSKTIYDYKHKTAYRISPGDKRCVSWEIKSGMLEPCMPEDAKYLGPSYIGFQDDKAEFRSFYFRRTDKNRNMEMTIAVTSEGCVPIMEHIRGKIGDAEADSLVFFSNVTSLQDEAVFKPPQYCFREPDK